MKRRIFTALPLDREFSKAFARYRDAYGKIPYLRWVPVKNFHITLVFIGAVDEEKMPNVFQAVESVASRTAPFALVFDSVIYAPPERRHKSMVWGMFKDSAEYDTLVEETIAALEDTTLPEDTFARQKNGKGKQKSVHTTLARFRDKKNPPRELRKLKPSGLEGKALGADRIQVMESRSHPDGVQYQLLDEFAFKESNPH